MWQQAALCSPACLFVLPPDPRASLPPTPRPPRSAQDFEKAGSLRDREMELKSQISAITSRCASAGRGGREAPQLRRRQGMHCRVASPALPGSCLMRGVHALHLARAVVAHPTPPLPPPHPCLPHSAKDAQRAEMESGEGGGPQVTDQDIANIVAQWTGIPIEKVSSDETERLVKMEEVLHGRVIGQVRGGAGWSDALAGSRGVLALVQRRLGTSAALRASQPAAVLCTSSCEAVARPPFSARRRRL